MVKSASRGNILIVLIIIAVLAISLAVYLKTNITPTLKNLNKLSPQPTNQPLYDNLQNYTSKDLKISFKYPKNWFMDDRYQTILLTNYKTSQNEDMKPTSLQIDIMISKFSGCHPELEENLKDQACGEGGKTVTNNQILSKEMKQISGGTYYKYGIKTPKNNILTYYIIQKDNRILEISKKPDPSQFEKEFEELINSIQFLE